MERRTHPRMAVNYDLYVAESGRTRSARGKDISPKGIGIVTDAKLDPGSAVGLTTYLADASLNLSLQGFVRHCVSAGPAGGGPVPYFVGIEFDEETKENFPFLQIQDNVMTHRASHTVRIEAPPAVCYELVSDYARYPQWVKFFESHQVRDRYVDGRPRRVEWTVNAFIRKVRFVNEYSYDDANLILSWVSHEGDLLENTGRWRFLPVGDRQTSATFELCASFDFAGPSRVLHYFSNVAMGRAMRDFARFVLKNKQP